MKKAHYRGIYRLGKKTFDTIDHKILLKKLYHYGLRGRSNDWVRSYLTSRKQYVKLEDCKSDCLEVVCGVPQGSILGPKLFILYINDMVNLSTLLKFILFADDTNLFCSGNDVNQLGKLVTKELNKLKDWFAINRLSLNVTKTNYMLFSNSKSTLNVAIMINNTAVNRVHSTKFLGVIIDEKLTWKGHVDLVKSKVAKNVFLLNRVKYILKYDSMLSLYNTLILPYLTYCCEIWGNTYGTRLKGLVIIQKKAIRLIHGAGYRDHTNMLFLEARALKLTDLVKMNLATIMYKAYHSSLPCNLQKLFTKVIHSDTRVTTRQTNKFKHPKHRTTMKSMCISIRGIQLWNSLDEKIIQECRSLHRFKTCLKQQLLKNYSEE